MRNIDERYSKAALISVQRVVERESLKESLAGYYEFRSVSSSISNIFNLVHTSNSSILSYIRTEFQF